MKKEIKLILISMLLVLTVNAQYKCVPVIFNSVNVTSSAKMVYINWNVEMEIGNSHYEVLMSENGKDFKTISIKQPEDDMDYTVIDTLITYGTVKFYRIKQVDKNGDFTFTPIIRFNPVISGVKIKVSPIPFSNQLFITTESTETFVASITLVKITGQIMARYTVAVSKGVNSFPINTDTFPSGAYIARIIWHDKVSVHRIMKM